MKHTVTEADAGALRRGYGRMGIPETWASVERTYTKKAMVDFLLRRARRARFLRETIALFREMWSESSKWEIVESFMAEVLNPWPKRR